MLRVHFAVPPDRRFAGGQAHDKLPECVAREAPRAWVTNSGCVLRSARYLVYRNPSVPSRLWSSGSLPETSGNPPERVSGRRKVREDALVRPIRAPFSCYATGELLRYLDRAEEGSAQSRCPYLRGGVSPPFPAAQGPAQR